MALQELPQKLPTRKTGKKYTHFPPQTARRSATSDPKSQPADAEQRQLTLGTPGGLETWKLGGLGSFNCQDISRQFIATSAEVTLNGGLGRESYPKCP